MTTIVREIAYRNRSTDQRSAFGGKSLECDGMLIRSEDHLGEFTVPIWKRYNEWLQS